MDIPDVCGVVANDSGYFITAGTGRLVNLANSGTKMEALSMLRWDNHLISVRGITEA